MIGRHVTVIDYGIGNLLNVVRALEHCGASVQVAELLKKAGIVEQKAEKTFRKIIKR